MIGVNQEEELPRRKLLLYYYKREVDIVQTTPKQTNQLPRSTVDKRITVYHNSAFDLGWSEIVDEMIFRHPEHLLIM